MYRTRFLGVQHIRPYTTSQAFLSRWGGKKSQLKPPRKDFRAAGRNVYGDNWGNSSTSETTPSATATSKKKKKQMPPPPPKKEFRAPGKNVYGDTWTRSTDESTTNAPDRGNIKRDTQERGTVKRGTPDRDTVHRATTDRGTITRSRDIGRGNTSSRGNIGSSNKGTSNIGNRKPLRDSPKSHRETLNLNERKKSSARGHASAPFAPLKNQKSRDSVYSGKSTVRSEGRGNVTSRVSNISSSGWFSGSIDVQRQKEQQAEKKRKVQKKPSNLTDELLRLHPEAKEHLETTPAVINQIARKRRFERKHGIEHEERFFSLLEPTDWLPDTSLDIDKALAIKNKANEKKKMKKDKIDNKELEDFKAELKRIRSSESSGNATSYGASWKRGTSKNKENTGGLSYDTILKELEEDMRVAHEVREKNKLERAMSEDDDNEDSNEDSNEDGYIDEYDQRKSRGYRRAKRVKEGKSGSEDIVESETDYVQMEQKLLEKHGTDDEIARHMEAALRRNPLNISALNIGDDDMEEDNDIEKNKGKNSMFGDTLSLFRNHLGLAQFPNVTSAHVTQYADYIIPKITELYKDLEALDSKDALWNNVVPLIEKISLLLSSLLSPIRLLSRSQTTHISEETIENCESRIAAIIGKIAASVQIHNHFATIKEQEWSKFNSSQKKVIDLHLQTCTFGDITLPTLHCKDGKAIKPKSKVLRLQKLIENLAQLQMEYSRRVSAFLKDRLNSPDDSNKKSAWSNNITMETKELVLDIIDKRRKIAINLGYSDYNELMSCLHSVKIKEQNEEFLSVLKTNSLKKLEADLPMLQDIFSKTHWGLVKPLGPQDILFTSHLHHVISASPCDGDENNTTLSVNTKDVEKVKASTEKLKMYFPATSVLSGIQRFLEQLFGITLKMRLDAHEVKDDSSIRNENNSRYRNDNSRYRNDNSRYRNENSRYRNDNSRYRNDNSRYRNNNSGARTISVGGVGSSMGSESNDTRIAWDRNIYYYDIVNTNKADTLLGGVFLDMKPRSGKDNNTEVITLRPSTIYSSVPPYDTARQNTPVLAVLTNYDSEDHLHICEIQDLLFSFGQVLQTVLSEVPYLTISGRSGVDVEGIDCIPHFLSQWIYHPDVLRSFSENNSLPFDQYEEVLKNRSIGAAYKILDEVSQSYLDYSLHSSNFTSETRGGKGDGNDELELLDFFQLQKQVLEKNMLLPVEKNESMVFDMKKLYNSDRFAGGSYGEQWSAVMGVNLFRQFLDASNDKSSLTRYDDRSNAKLVLDHTIKKKGRDLRKKILSNGGSLNFLDSFKNFKGGDNPSPDILQYLKYYGII